MLSHILRCYQHDTKYWWGRRRTSAFVTSFRVQNHCARTLHLYATLVSVRTGETAVGLSRSPGASAPSDPLDFTEQQRAIRGHKRSAFASERPLNGTPRRIRVVAVREAARARRAAAGQRLHLTAKWQPPVGASPSLPVALL